MAMTTLTIDIDEDELARFNEACAARGMTVQTALYNFLNKFRRPTGIDKTFIKVKRKFDTWRDLRVIDALCKEAQKNGTSGMSMEEIDAEIALARKERREREDRENDIRRN